MKAPNIWLIDELAKYWNNPGIRVSIEREPGDTIFLPARPLGYGGLRSRLKAAWMVFSGNADAVYWHHQ